MMDNIVEREKRLLQRLSDHYLPLQVNGIDCFMTTAGAVFTIDLLATYNALVIGHANNIYEAECNCFEDGDLFFLDEMNEDEMFEAMIHEIEM